MSVLDSVIDKLALTTVEDDVEVSFAGKGLKLNTEEDACEIVEAIKKCSGMTSLCLEGNTIGVAAAKAIGKALESQPNFKKALWKDMFTQRTEHEIPDALGFLGSGIMLANAHLVELDLSDNAFGPRGLKGVVNLLKSQSCFTLQELRLNNNGLGISGAKMLASALSQCLENSTEVGKPLKLKLLICGRNRLENEGSLALANFIKNVKTLEYIAMPQNGIYHVGIAGLAEAVASNSQLKVLNLEDNSLTEKGAKHMSKVLQNLTNLETLNFGDCLLRTGGAIYLAGALSQSCPKLTELNLGFNEISEHGGVELVKSLRDKNFLENLILNGNHFGTDGCKAIMSNMIAIDKFDVLGSLSEDETSDEDDDNNESRGNDANESKGDVNEDDVNENDVSDNRGDGDKISVIDESLCEKNEISYDELPTFADFIVNPSMKDLIKLFEANISMLPELPSIKTWNDCFNLFLKVSSVVTPDCENLKAAYHYANEVLSAAFSCCDDESMWMFNNDFLVALGLIKNEEKKKETKENETIGALILLQHSVKSDYFQQSTRELLKFMLSRPVRSGVGAPKIVSALLKLLYQN